MTTDDKITLTGEKEQHIQFDKKGEQVVYFKARINSQTGMSTLRTEATSGNETAIVTEDVQVRIPNPRMTEIEEKEAKAGETVSSIPALQEPNRFLSWRYPLSHR